MAEEIVFRTNKEIDRFVREELIHTSLDYTQKEAVADALKNKLSFGVSKTELKRLIHEFRQHPSEYGGLSTTDILTIEDKFNSLK